jgi:hypothetical protein
MLLLPSAWADCGPSASIPAGSSARPTSVAPPDWAKVTTGNSIINMMISARSRLKARISCIYGLPFVPIIVVPLNLMCHVLFFVMSEQGSNRGITLLFGR